VTSQGHNESQQAAYQRVLAVLARRRDFDRGKTEPLWRVNAHGIAAFFEDRITKLTLINLISEA